MAITLITYPNVSPVSLAEAKAHLNVDFSDHDALIDSMVKAATSYAEKFTGRSFINTTWELVLDSFPTSEISIPNPPLIEVLSIRYYALSTTDTVLDPSAYVVDRDSQPGWVVPVSTGWPSTLDMINAVRIRYRAGYVDDDASPAAGEVPSDIRAAILWLIGTFYAHRETVVVGQLSSLLPWSAEQLLRPYRVHTAMA